MHRGAPPSLLRNHLEAVATAAAFVALHAAGFIAPVSIWVLLALIAAGAALRDVSDRLFAGDLGAPMHARLGIGTLTTGSVMFATGWGPVLSIGFVFMAASNIRRSGSSTVGPTMLWSTVGMGAGQMAIAYGVAPTLIPMPLVHGLALLGWMGTIFVIRLVGASTKQMENAREAAATAYGREHASAERLRRLNSCLTAISSSWDLRQMLDSIALAAKETFDAVFAVVLFQDDHALLTGAMTPGVARPELSIYSRDARAGGPSATALATGRIVKVEDFEAAADPDVAKWAEAVRSLGVRSMVVVPLKEENVALGVLNVYFSEPRTITEEEEQILGTFADEAMVAVARVRALEGEKAARIRLEELDELKDRFISTVSHELRTPLTAIGGFASTLVERWHLMDDDLKLSLLDRIARNGTEMQRLVEQLLDMSRLNKGHVNIELKPLDLRKQVGLTLASLTDPHDRRLFLIEISEGLQVYADPDGFNRILSNLVTNAMKYSAAEAPIEIRAKTEGLDVLIQVTDHGPGIPKQEQEHIFEPFYQGASRKAGKSGTGIGLDIARRFVEMHGGRIWVESTESGSTFSFTLPHLYSTRQPPARRAIV